MITFKVLIIAGTNFGENSLLQEFIFDSNFRFAFWVYETLIWFISSMISGIDLDNLLINH